jgi:hypothetical protein
MIAVKWGAAAFVEPGQRLVESGTPWDAVLQQIES